MFTIGRTKYQTFTLPLAVIVILFSCRSVDMEQVPTEQIDQEVRLIQATLIVARLEQPGLPRYQFSPREYETLYSVFGNTSGLSAKVIKAVPMSRIEGGEPKRSIGWAIEIGDAWIPLFQIEKIERAYQRETYKTWPLIEFRRGKIFFLEDGIQVSEDLEARVNKHQYIYKKDKGWVSRGAQ